MHDRSVRPETDASAGSFANAQSARHWPRESQRSERRNSSSALKFKTPRIDRIPCKTRGIKKAEKRPLPLLRCKLLQPLPAPLGQPEIPDYKGDLASSGGHRDPKGAPDASSARGTHLQLHQVPPTPRERSLPVFRDVLQLQSLKPGKCSSFRAQAHGRPDRGASRVTEKSSEVIEVISCLLDNLTTVLGDLDTHKLRFDAPVASPSRCARRAQFLQRFLTQRSRNPKTNRTGSLSLPTAKGRTSSAFHSEGADTHRLRGLAQLGTVTPHKRLQTNFSP